MRRMIIVSAFILSALCAFAESPRAVVNSGHNGRISEIIYSEKYDRLISCGTDGRIIVSDPSSGTALHSFQVSGLPLKMIAANPEEQEIAIIETDDKDNRRLSVWNWRRETEMFSTEIRKTPLFLNYSSKGNFIYYGVADWKSLTFLDSENGEVLPYLTESFGIISAAFTSATEKTLLTYNPSGTIQYWDIQTGDEKGSIRTIPNLTAIRFNKSGRFISASNGKKLILLDMTTGRALSSADIENIQYTAISNEQNLISCCYIEDNEIMYSQWNFTSSVLSARSLARKLDTATVSGLTYGKNTVYLSDDSGRITAVTPGKTVVISENRMAPVSDIAANADALVLTAGDQILTMPISYIEAIAYSARAGYNRSMLYENPFSNTAGISPAEEGSFILYDKQYSEKPPVYFDPVYGFGEDLENTQNGINSITARDGRILSLDTEGLCSITNAGSGEMEYQYSSFGLKTVTFINDGKLIAGRTKTDIVFTPLLHINPATGETVPINDNNIHTFTIDYDNVTRTLYSLGIEEKHNTLRTVLKAHRGSSFEKTETILAFRGENPDAAFVVDPADSSIYTTLGYGEITLLSWNGFTSLEKTDHIPGKLVIHGDYLFSLNTDLSVSVFNKNTGRAALELYLFDDYSWLAVLPSGKFHSAKNGERYLSIYKGDEETRLNLKSYRKP